MFSALNLAFFSLNRLQLGAEMKQGNPQLLLDADAALRGALLNLDKP